MLTGCTIYTALYSIIIVASNFRTDFVLFFSSAYSMLNIAENQENPLNICNIELYEATTHKTAYM